jgi:hypothetical protein
VADKGGQAGQRELLAAEAAGEKVPNGGVGQPLGWIRIRIRSRSI